MIRKSRNKMYDACTDLNRYVFNTYRLYLLTITSNPLFILNYYKNIFWCLIIKIIYKNLYSKPNLRTYCFEEIVDITEKKT